ncbi:hypothetical protein [Deinococcus altitudinis]|uniref:hypothetical protein n=1 Tax=Deinococcus altitudinis TaxID=468914 RepID=UPI003891D078
MRFRRLFSSNRLTLTLSVVVLLAAVVLSCNQRDFRWLSRLGNLLTLLGIIQISRPQLADREIKPGILSSDSPYKLNDLRHWNHIGEPAPEWVYEDLSNRTAVSVLGPLTTLVGAIAAGFGDLLNPLLGFPP